MDWRAKEILPSRREPLLLAVYAQVNGDIVATDDLEMHKLASDFGLRVWHGFELLAKLKTAKAVDTHLVRDIYDALERNNDMRETWRKAKDEEFASVFGVSSKQC